MMLATRCPYCRTTFRVVQDQLKICNGIVRCGSCRQVFNGIEQLQSASAAALGETEQAPAQNGALWPESAASDVDPVTIVVENHDQADFTEAHDDPNRVPKPAGEVLQHIAPPDVAAAPAFAEETENAPALRETKEPHPDRLQQADDRRVREVEDGFRGDDASRREADNAESFEPTVMPAAHFTQDTEDEPAHHATAQPQVAEPVFVQLVRRRERFGRIARMAMVLLVLLLLPALFLQTVDAFHQRIGAAFPMSKPMLEQVCGIVDCQSELPAQIEAVSIDSSELYAPKNGESAFALTLLLRNRSALTQAWPYIELTLNDADEKPVARRVFNASEYLSGSQDPAKGVSAHSEHSLKLVFEVEQPLKPVGYRVYLFYP